MTITKPVSTPTFDDLIADARAAVAKLSQATRAIASQHFRELKHTEHARYRAQLWAEAAHYETQGMSIALPEHLWSAAKVEQEQRREADPWEDTLGSVKGQNVRNEKGDLEERVFSDELFQDHLRIDVKDRTPSMAKRLGTCMRILGWLGPKVMKIFNETGRGYWR
jgi:hypothetical protein